VLIEKLKNSNLCKLFCA